MEISKPQLFSGFHGIKKAGLCGKIFHQKNIIIFIKNVNFTEQFSLSIHKQFQ
jgi:hypothetical protein